jgi:hypothetical protein
LALNPWRWPLVRALWPTTISVVLVLIAITELQISAGGSLARVDDAHIAVDRLLQCIAAQKANFPSKKIILTLSSSQRTNHIIIQLYVILMRSPAYCPTKVGHSWGCQCNG